jgi:hypothetical protein
MDSRDVMILRLSLNESAYYADGVDLKKNNRR